MGMGIDQWEWKGLEKLILFLHTSTTDCSVNGRNFTRRDRMLKIAGMFFETQCILIYQLSLHANSA